MLDSLRQRVIRNKLPESTDVRQTQSRAQEGSQGNYVLPLPMATGFHDLFGGKEKKREEQATFVYSLMYKGYS